MSPVGVTEGGWVAAPTDVAGAGAAMFAYDLEDPVTTRAMVGGPGFPGDANFDKTGFNRIVTGYDGGIPASMGAPSTWRAALNPHASPTFWVLLFALAAVGLIYARVELAGRAGPFSAHGGVAV